MKPYYDHGGITIYHGDNCEVLGSLDRQSFDLAVTSPPYDDLREYGGHEWDFYGVAWHLKRALVGGGVAVWVVGDATKDGSETQSSMRQALHFRELGFNLHDTMIYQVPGTGAKGSNLAYWQVWEYMFVFSVGRPKTVNRLRDKRNVSAGSFHGVGSKQPTVVGTRGYSEEGVTVDEFGYRDNVWKMLAGNNGDYSTDHPAPFPEALARDHILTWSNPGDAILDPFAGSGTTLRMAKDLGRTAVGIEINERYCEIAAKRLEQEVLPL